VPYQTSNTNGSIYTWLTDGGAVAEGQSTSTAKFNWTNEGIYKLWVFEENTTSTDYCSGVSDTLLVTVFQDLAAITMNFVSVDLVNDKQLQLQWDVSLLERVSDLVIVSRRITGSTNPWEIVATLEKNVQSFLDENLSTSTNIYEYKVEGFNKCDEGLQTVIHNTIKLAGDKVEEEELINLDWNDYNGWDEVEHYEVWRKLDTETDYKLVDVTPGDLTLYSGKHGADGFVHHLRIKAKKKDANTISWSNEIELDFDNPIDFIPNVITPNGDLKNDSFVIPKLHLYPDNALTIYDRWGKTVFSKNNYDNSWNGTGLTEGVYFYALYIKVLGKNLNGWVQVVR
jgi:gliding motility-associated-like protein